MRSLLRMWDGSNVVYEGGRKFFIEGNFHVLSGLNLKAPGKTYRTRVEVEVLPEGEVIYSDQEMIEKIRTNPLYRQSLANRIGLPGGVSELEAMPESEQIRLALANRPVGVSSTNRMTTGEDGFSVTGDMVGVITGKIVLAQQTVHPNVIYHEYFHSVMKFIKATGVLSQEDIDNLRAMYGDSAKYGTSWFNEEVAAEDFRKFVQEHTEDPSSGVFQKIRDFLGDLFSILFRNAGGFEPSAYFNEDYFNEHAGANSMEANPLASIVLTGRAVRSLPSTPSHVYDFRTKVGRALATYGDTMREYYERAPDASEEYVQLQASTFGPRFEGSALPPHLALGYSITDVDDETLAAMDQGNLRASREGMMMAFYNPEWAVGTEFDVDSLLAFGRYLDALGEITEKASETSRTKGRGTAARERMDAVKRLDEESGTDLFREMYIKFMKEFAPENVGAEQTGTPSEGPSRRDVSSVEAAPADVSESQREVAESIATTPTIPNQNHESDIMSLFSALPAVEAAGEYDGDAPGIALAGADADENFVIDDDPFEFSLGGSDATDVIRTVVTSVVPDRMARPYTRQYLLAAEVARAIRAGFSRDALSASTISNLSRSLADRHAIEVHAAIEDAIIRLGRLYGVDTSNTTEVRKYVYRAMYELNSGIVSDNRADGREAGGSIRHAAAHKGDASPASFYDYAKGVDLAALVAASSGVRPCDMVESVLNDIDRIVENGGYSPTSSFYINVVSPVRSAISRFASMDPSDLFNGADAMTDDWFGSVVSSIRGGLVGGILQDDGSRSPFVVADRGSTENPDGKANIEKYADHVGNPDFQNLMFTVLDTLYMAKAAVKYYRQIGMEPGRVEDTIMIRGLAPEAPAPMSQAEMMDSLRISPEQLVDPGFDAVEFYDQPWFSARDPEMFLMSTMRPSFGGVSIRENMMEEAREFAGYHTREAANCSLDDRRLGLDVVAGDAYTAIDNDYTGSGFRFEAGRISHDGRSRKTERYFGKDRKKAIDPATGKEIIVTKRDQRVADLWSKAVKVFASGGTKVLTGVDRITFSASDSFDPADYTYDKVIAKRSSRKDGSDYNDIDKAVIRLYRQLHDDNSGESWDDIVGENGLDIVGRFVREACAAMKQAHELMGRFDEYGNPVLSEREFNDFVLRRLSLKGVIAAHEAFIPGLRRHAMDHGVITISVDEIDKMFHNSSTYRKLVLAGRPEDKLTMKGMAEPHMKLFRELKEFLAKHPYLSDGDGAFFHNATTTLPFVRGSGFFMYHANRREHDTVVENVEALNSFENGVYSAMKDIELVGPAAGASDQLLRVARDVFHLEPSVEAIRASISEGRYSETDGFHITADSTVKDLVDAIYNRLTGMLWKANGDPVIEKAGGASRVRRALGFIEEKLSNESSVVSGGVGMTDDMVYRMTGVLPANHRIGHAVMNAVDGISNAFKFRSAMVAMMTTPDEDGMPTCYARPADDAAETSGISDTLWSVIARWWAETSGDPDARYDTSLTGVRNAQRIYDAIHRKIGKGGVMKDGTGRRFGELLPSDIDPKSITGFIANAGVPEDESSLSRLGGGYALGYAKHLLQASRATGTNAAGKLINRALAWSKGLSVTFSYFFPLATRFESPTGAVGAMATMLGNFTPGSARKFASTMKKLQGMGTGKGWITKDFVGFKDVEEMLDSNDPFLAQLYEYAGCLGIGLSDARSNPDSEGRGILVDDLNRVVSAAREAWGDKAARTLYKVMDSILLRGGEKAFTYHLNATKLAVTAQLCQKLQAKADAEGRAFDAVRDLKKYSSYINAEIGGIDPLQYAWSHPKARSVLNGLFFSWGWTRGAWEAGGGKVVEQVLFGGHDATRDERGYMIGRSTRMLLQVMLGFPMMMQIICKALGMALDPDHEDREDEKWFTWQNEDKTFLMSFDITPVMRGLAKRFPGMAEFMAKHPVLRAIPAVAAGVAHKPWLLAFAPPVYTGTDAANQTTRGRHYYMHFGKQGWEFLRWFTDPKGNFFSKLSMPVQRAAEGVLGRSLTWLDHPLPWANQGDVERWAMFLSPQSAGFNMLRAFLPFSMSSLIDVGDAGALSMVAPITMGASASAVTGEIEDRLRKFIADDRRGYASASPIRLRRGEKYANAITRRDVTIAGLVDQARRNGFTDKDAHKLVNNAVNRITTGLYTELVDALPIGDPDQDYDTARVARILRKANRLGRMRDDIMKSVQARLEKQNRWLQLPPETRKRIKSILMTTATAKDPYGDTPALDRTAGIRYTY